MTPPGPTEPTPPRPPQPLLRPQVARHVAPRTYGSVLLAQPLSHRFLASFLFGITLCVLAFFACFSTTRRTDCQGILTPTAGIVRVMPGQAGVIVSGNAREGQLVHAGDVLFVLSAERRSLQPDSLEQTVTSLLRERHDSFVAELSQLKAQQRQRLEEAKRHVLELHGDIGHMDDEIAFQQQRVDLADQAIKRNKELQATGYISAAQMQEKQIDALDQRQRLVELRRTKIVRQQDLDASEAVLRDWPLQSSRDLAVLERNIATTDQDIAENEAKRRIQVVAPQDGVLTAVTAIAGQTVTPTTPLAAVLPRQSELEADVYLPSRSIGFVRKGMPVLLRYEAYPYQKFGQFGARVDEIANTSMRPEDLLASGVDIQLPSGGEPLYRVRLLLDSQTVRTHAAELALKPGMLLDASILLEHRRLYEWVLDPILALAK